LFPGTSGKITGTVRSSDTGIPLMGVNVVLANTSLGAVTDSSGIFTLLNISPGKYTINASMIGYADFTLEDLIVRIDQTSIVEIVLTQKSIEMGQITVNATKPVVVHDISNSQINISSDEITTLPFDEISEVLGLQAGIEGLSVRGGGSRESLFQVDGLSYNDERSHVPYMSIPLGIIKEVQIQTGGFNAEYGNIRSGVINIILDEGDKKNYHGGLTFRHSPPAQKHFGNSLFSDDSYFLRPYLDDDVAWSGTENGNWDAYTRNQYPSFEGWNAVSDATINDDDPSNDLTPQAAQQIFKWQHRRHGVIKHPDENLDFFLSGPVPLISSRLGSLRFVMSYRHENEAFIFPLSFDDFSDRSMLVKLTSDLSLKTKLNLSFQSGMTESVSPYNWKTTPTGSYLRSTYEVANILNSSSGNSILFMPGYFSPTRIKRQVLGIKADHMFSEKEFLELVVQVQTNDYNTYQTNLRDTTKINDILPGYDDFFVDEAPFGYWGYGETGIDGMNIGGWMNIGRDSSKISTTSLKLDYTNQYRINHQLKTGVGATLNDYSIRSSANNPGMSTWNRSMNYNVSPYRVYAYAQDKIEYKGFIANIGLRTDVSSGNTDVYDLGPYDDLFKQGAGHDIESSSETNSSEPIYAVSPRLGISHPITDRSKLFFNYGHFYSEPSSSYRFRLQRESNGLVTHIGDPNMVYEKTIAYETGFSANPYGDYLLNLSLFYKDITSQPGWVYYQNMNGTIQVNRIENNNYEDIRGIELTIKKNMGRFITGMMNYTYLVQSSGYFGLLSQFQDPNMQRDYESLNRYQSKPRPRPFFRSVINFRTPQDFGPKIFNNAIMGDWISSFIFNYKAGAFETYNPQGLPGISDNVQWKDTYSTDARIKKSLRLKNVKIDLILDIKNVFNNKFLSYAGFSNYYDYIDYLESLRFPWEEGKEKGSDRVGDFRDLSTTYASYDPEDWENLTDTEKEILKTKAYIDMPNIKAISFLDPRDIYFGVTVHF
jgi:outer membrane receptor protein involved in Fe transport